MKITLTVPRFEIDSDVEVAILAFSDNKQIGLVTIQFDSNGAGQHRILTDFSHFDYFNRGQCLPHYVQAKVIYEASKMIDRFFAPDGRAIKTRKTITA